MKRFLILVVVLAVVSAEVQSSLLSKRAVRMSETLLTCHRKTVQCWKKN